jgi:hypothetical protein
MIEGLGAPLQREWRDFRRAIRHGRRYRTYCNAALGRSRRLDSLCTLPADFGGHLARRRAARLSRRRPSATRHEIRKQARRIGEIIIGWNDLQSGFFHIFWNALGAERYDLAHGLWHRVQNDRTQRLMAATAVETNPHISSKIRRHVKWLTAFADKYSDYRNAAAHVPLLFHPEGSGRVTVISDFVSAREQAVKRLRYARQQRLWRLLCADLYVMTEFALRLSAEIHLPKAHGPLPRKPRLLALPMIKEVERLMNH